MSADDLYLGHCNETSGRPTTQQWHFEHNIPATGSAFRLLHLGSDRNDKQYR